MFSYFDVKYKKWLENNFTIKIVFRDKYKGGLEMLLRIREDGKTKLVVLLYIAFVALIHIKHSRQR